MDEKFRAIFAFHALSVWSSLEDHYKSHETTSIVYYKLFLNIISIKRKLIIKNY